jgi:hypothetical protein
MAKATLEKYVQRFWSYVAFEIPRGYETNCWEWTRSTRGGNQGEHAKKSRKGVYGQFWFRGKMVYAHRFAYEICVGTIPEGYEIDHLCENTLCCRPTHLRAVSPVANARYSSGIPRPEEDAIKYD